MAQLSRSIGVRGLTASLFNTTVGAGIFAMPALVAQMLGASAVYAYLTCAIAMLGIVLAMAVAASRVPRAGGTYAYAEAAFGPFVGSLAGMMVWLSDLLASSAVAAGLAGAVGQRVPTLATPVGRVALLALVLGTLAWVNVRGVRQGTRVVEAITVAKVAPLLILVAAGLVVGGSEMWSAGPLPEPGTIGRATLVLVFAFAGAESALALGEEVTEPSRTIPRALVIALTLITGLYVLVHLSAAAALGATLPQTPDATLAAAAGVLMGPIGRGLLLAGTVVSMLGYVSALVMATPRLVFAMARRGLLPASLGRVHPQWRTPAAAIVAHTVLLFLVASSGSFAALAGFASVAVMSVYLLVCVSALQLQRSNTQVADDGGVRDSGEARRGECASRAVAGAVSLHVPPALLVVATFFCAALLSQATRAELLVEVAVLAAAAIWHLLRHGRIRPLTANWRSAGRRGPRLP